MELNENSRTVSEIINQQITSNNQQIDKNLEWLQAQMHSMFFTLNRDEIDALSLLTSNLHKMDYHKRLLLVDKPRLIMLAQVDKKSSLYESLKELPKKAISYSEFTTSPSTLPNGKDSIEVLRIEYKRKLDKEVAEELKTIEVPLDILQQVSSELDLLNSNHENQKIIKLLKILLVNNPEYIRVSPPKRIARLLNLYHETVNNDGIYLDLETIDDEAESGKYRILLGTSNPPIKGYLIQLMEVFDRMNISVRRSYSLTLSNGLYPFFLSTFYVHLRDKSPLLKNSEYYLKLQHEIYNTQILSAYSRSYRSLVKPRITTGADASLIDAMIGFCHTNLSHNNPDTFGYDSIMRAFHNHADITTQLIDLFHVRFDPTQTNREETYAETLTSTILAIAEFNSGRKFLDEFRRTVFHCGLVFIQNTLKTNFFVEEKHALSFRIDPVYLEQLDEKFTEDLPSDRPFRITFFYGRNGIAYHIGFSDIAHGGWRTVITQGRDNYVTSSNSVFKENYVLAHTQHLKNKDIYEGGSKMVALLRVSSSGNTESNRQQLYKLQMAFINAFFDLFVTEKGSAKNKNVVDYYQQDEPIELGPDENMHDYMVELIAKQSVKRGYMLGPGVMSSKKVGINHKEYGVTSIGVIRFAEVTMKALGIDMHRDEFSVKFTGGPNGDVGSWKNQFTVLCFPLSNIWADQTAWPQSPQDVSVSQIIKPKNEEADKPLETQTNQDTSASIESNENIKSNSPPPQKMDLNLPSPPFTELDLPIPPGIEILESSAKNSPVSAKSNAHKTPTTKQEIVKPELKESSYTEEIKDNSCGKNFVDWMSNGIADGSITINQQQAMTHIIGENKDLILVSPKIFRVYASKRDLDYKVVQRSFQLLGLHSQNGDINIWPFKTLTKRSNKSEGKLNGMLIKNAEAKLNIKLPPPNSHITYSN